MAQFINWLKAFFVNKQQDKFISFNKLELQKRLADCANELYGNGGAKMLTILQDVITTCRNIQILDSNLVDPSKNCDLAIAHHRARIACLTDLLGWIERAVDSEDFKRRTKGNEPSGTKSMVRRQIQPGRPFAGPAL